MKFSKKETELLSRLCREYIRAKELVTKTENIDQRSGANIQINKEYRDALSHLLRIIGDQLLDDGGKKKKESYYYASNLDKAIGHIYRVGYDAIDGITIALREYINETSLFPLSVQNQAVPNFSKKIAQLDAFHNKIVQYKNEKDIGEESAKAFDKCIKELDNIQGIAGEVISAIPVMHDIHMQKKIDRKISRWQAAIFALSTLILGYLLNHSISFDKIVQFLKSIFSP